MKRLIIPYGHLFCNVQKTYEGMKNKNKQTNTESFVFDKLWFKEFAFLAISDFVFVSLAIGFVLLIILSLPTFYRFKHRFFLYR